jgi:cytochrome b involved in lipid metabolism
MSFEKYTLEEIKNHNKGKIKTINILENDCWVIIKDKVYDVTNFINLHPGK